MNTRRQGHSKLVGRPLDENGAIEFGIKSLSVGQGFTAGPWKAIQDDCPWTEGDAQTAIEQGETLGETEILFSMLAANGDIVARLPWEPLSDKTRLAELAANANLIQASPELFSLAETVVGGYDYNPGSSDLDGEQPIYVQMTLADYRKARLIVNRVAVRS